MTKCLFIGGGQDGRRIAVGDNVRLAFPVVTEGSYVEQHEEYRRAFFPSIATQETYEEEYRREQLITRNTAPVRVDYVYVHESIPRSEIIQRLIDGYRPAESERP